MAVLEGFDDRALILEDGFLTVTRWGDTVERIRLRFGAIATAIWLEADREQEVRDFAAAVDAARA